MKELCKNMAILFLSCSAVYLVSRVEAFTKFTHYLGEEDSITVQEVYSAVEEPVGVVLPSVMVALGGEGDSLTQVGVQSTEEVFLMTSQILKECLGNLATVEEVGLEEYMAALAQAPSLYYQWTGEIPLGMLSQWLSEEDSLEQTGQAKGILLTGDVDGMALYYQSGEGFFRCGLSALEVSRLESVVAQVEGEGVAFAFQQEAWSSLYPLTLLWETERMPVVFSAATPYDEGHNPLLDLLGFQAASSSQYSIQDGVAIRSGTDSLRLTYDGMVSYQSEEQSRFLLSHSQEEITLLEQVEGCWQYGLQIYQTLVTVPELSFYGVSEEEEGRVISFSASLSGIPLSYGNDVVAMEFTVVEDEIKSFSIYYRNYLATETYQPVLPLAQALQIMASHDLEGRELVLAYPDQGGESLTATWVTP